MTDYTCVNIFSEARPVYDSIGTCTVSFLNKITNCRFLFSLPILPTFPSSFSTLSNFLGITSVKVSVPVFHWVILIHNVS